MSKVEDQRAKELRAGLAYIGWVFLNDLIVEEDQRSWLQLDSWQGISSDGGRDE